MTKLKKEEYERVREILNELYDIYHEQQHLFHTVQGIRYMIGVAYRDQLITEWERDMLLKVY